VRPWVARQHAPAVQLAPQLSGILNHVCATQVLHHLELQVAGSSVIGRAGIDQASFNNNSLILLAEQCLAGEVMDIGSEFFLILNQIQFVTKITR
jgi:hypothetical protein